MTVRVTMVGGKRVAKFLKKYGDEAIRALGASLLAEGREVERLARNEIRSDMGILKASGFTELPEFRLGGGTVTVRVKFGGPAAKYAPHVHYGTKAYWIPIAPLKEWASRVLGDEKLGYAVQWKLAHVDRPGTFFLERPFKRRQNGLGLRLANDMRRRLESRGIAGRKK